MSDNVIYSGISWAALHESSRSWLPDDPANALILTPSTWKTERTPFRFADCATLTTVELLERYLETKFNRKRLLSKAARTPPAARADCALAACSAQTASGS